MMRKYQLTIVHQNFSKSRWSFAVKCIPNSFCFYKGLNFINLWSLQQSPTNLLTLLTVFFKCSSNQIQLLLICSLNYLIFNGNQLRVGLVHYKKTIFVELLSLNEFETFFPMVEAFAKFSVVIVQTAWSICTSCIKNFGQDNIPIDNSYRYKTKRSIGIKLSQLLDLLEPIQPIHHFIQPFCVICKEILLISLAHCLLLHYFQILHYPKQKQSIGIKRSELLDLLEPIQPIHHFMQRFCIICKESLIIISTFPVASLFSNFYIQPSLYFVKKPSEYQELHLQLDVVACTNSPGTQEQQG